MINEYWTVSNGDWNISVHRVRSSVICRMSELGTTLAILMVAKTCIGPQLYLLWERRNGTVMSLKRLLISLFSENTVKCDSLKAYLPLTWNFLSYKCKSIVDSMVIVTDSGTEIPDCEVDGETIDTRLGPLTRQTNPDIRWVSTGNHCGFLQYGGYYLWINKENSSYCQPAIYL